MEGPHLYKREWGVFASVGLPKVFTLCWSVMTPSDCEIQTYTEFLPSWRACMLYWLKIEEDAEKFVQMCVTYQQDKWEDRSQKTS